MHSTWHTELLAIAARCSGSELPQPLTQILHLCTWWFHPLQLALMAFSSAHWHRYCICTQATCTLWWWCPIICIEHQATRTYMYTHVCTRNNPVHELCIAQGSMHTTHIQHRELQTADITRVITNAR